MSCVRDRKACSARKPVGENTKKTATRRQPTTAQYVQRRRLGCCQRDRIRAVHEWLQCITLFQDKHLTPYVRTRSKRPFYTYAHQRMEPKEVAASVASLQLDTDPEPSAAAVMAKVPAASMGIYYLISGVEPA